MNQLGIDGEVQPERVCACGCGRSLDGMRKDAIYASNVCRALAYRHDRGIIGYRPVKGVLNGKSGPSGMQCSYRKVVGLLEEHFISRGEPYAHSLAVSLAKAALSDRQRARLNARMKTQQAAWVAEGEQRERQAA